MVAMAAAPAIAAQAVATAGWTEEADRLLAGDIGAESLLPGADRAGAPVGIERAAQQAAAGLPELPRGVGLQLAEAAGRFPDRPVELTLSPEELGRVRMTLTTVDGALTLAVSAERPETLDLLRRHIDELARDFRALGYSDVNFSFQDRPQGGDRSAEGRAPGAEGEAGETLSQAAPKPRAPEPIRLALGTGQGLDLRF
jgi:hypothetical protein